MTWLCVILDDHSLLIPFAAYHLAAHTAAFLDCFKQAVLRRSLPLKLYTDQGKPFVNHHARLVCANPGTRLLHARPCHAWSKGKLERLIRTIQGDFEATLLLESLAEAGEGNPRTLNLLARAAWIADARNSASSIEADHVHAALHRVPATNAKISRA